jgi:excisionase family DNA binding protein
LNQLPTQDRAPLEPVHNRSSEPEGGSPLKQPRHLESSAVRSERALLLRLTPIFIDLNRLLKLVVGGATLSTVELCPPKALPFDKLGHRAAVRAVSEPWVSVEAVAEHLGVAKDSVYRWIERRGLPAHRAGRLWKFKLSEVDAWVRASRAPMVDVQNPGKGR